MKQCMMVLAVLLLAVSPVHADTGDSSPVFGAPYEGTPIYGGDGGSSGSSTGGDTSNSSSNDNLFPPIDKYDSEGALIYGGDTGTSDSNTGVDASDTGGNSSSDDSIFGGDAGGVFPVPAPDDSSPFGGPTSDDSSNDSDLFGEDTSDDSPYPAPSDLFGGVSDNDTFNSALPIPSSQETFSYHPAEVPYKDSDPSRCKPFAIGASYFSDGITPQVGLPPFAGDVDVYLGVQTPDSPEILLVGADDATITPLSAGIIPWREDVSFQNLDVGLFGTIPPGSLTPGTYRLYLMVTPANSMDSFYLWQSYFELW